MVSHPIPPALIVGSGEARWARLTTASGDGVILLTVGTKDADIIVNSTRFEFGGGYSLDRVTLSLPTGRR